MKLTMHHSGKFYKGVNRDLQSPQRRGDQQLTYTEGLTLTADGIDLDPDNDCGSGINFCRSIADALRWGPVVVEIRVPERTPVVDTGDKLRAKKVVVGPVVSLAGANLYGADLAGAILTGANLSRANLYGANLTRAILTRANLSETRGDKFTILPPGYELTKAGLIVKSK